MQNRNNDQKAKELEELVVEIKSVVKVTSGGRQRRFSATVVVGNRKGKVGLGIGKANEVPDAIKKAIQAANKKLIVVPITDGRTIAHEVIGTAGAARVILKPAPEGSGVIAGGVVRSIMDSVGVTDVLAKVLGSKNQVNVTKATILGLQSLRNIKDVAARRGKKMADLF